VIETEGIVEIEGIGLDPAVQTAIATVMTSPPIDIDLRALNRTIVAK
jgi:hypothetical protein